MRAEVNAHMLAIFFCKFNGKHLKKNPYIQIYLFYLHKYALF